MKTDKAIELAGSREALARLIGVTPLATYRWKPNVPERHMWKLAVIRPDWFTKEKKQ